MAADDLGAATGGNPVLRFFGLHTAEHAGETALWVAPYLALFLCALIAMSLLVQRFFPLAIWVHVLAVSLAGVNCFLFLARIRWSALGDDDEDEDGAAGDGTQEE